MDHWMKRFTPRDMLHQGGGIYALIVMVSIMGAFCLELPFGQRVSQGTIQAGMIAALLAIVCLGCVWMAQRRLDAARVVMLLFAAGMILRAGYILYTPYLTRQHDLGLPGPGEHGHLGYIQVIMDTWRLPDNNIAQFYHPPLHHLISAVWMTGMRALGLADAFSWESLSWVTLCWSGFMMVFAIRLLDRVIFQRLRQDSGGARALTATLICLHPAMIRMSAGLNNDTLLWTCVLASLLALVHWMDWPSLPNAAKVGLALGAAMMAKFSGLLYAGICALFMLYWLCYRSHPAQRGSRWAQCLTAGGIAAGLGLWHPIRNLAAFGQPLGYVMRISESDPVYCGQYNLWDRFLSIPLDQLQHIYCQRLEDFSLQAYVIKNSVFGEYIFYGADAAATVLLISNVLLILLSLAAMIWVVVTDRSERTRLARWLFALVWLIQMAMFILFNFSYAYRCTMDFRYIVPTLVCGVAFLALAWENAKKWRWIRWAIGVISGLFCLSSVVFFCMIT